MWPRQVMTAAGVAGACALAGVLLLDAASRPSAQRRLVILAASSLSGALGVGEGGLDADLSFAASGAHYLAVVRGRRFDVLITASAEHAERLVESGVARTAAPLASGCPFLVTRGPAPVGNLVEWLGHHPSIRVAIPNPKHAPFGASAAEWLRDQGIDYQRDGRFVVAQSVESAVSLVARGAVDAAFIAEALTPRAACATPLPGARPVQYWCVVSRDAPSQATDTIATLSWLLERAGVARAQPRGE